MTQDQKNPSPPPMQRVVEANKASLFPALHAAGVARVVFNYSGEGDSGDFYDCTYFKKIGEELKSLTADEVLVVEALPANLIGSDLLPEETTLGKALEDLTEMMLQDGHGGWENGDGGNGEFIFDVIDSSVEWIHRDAYIEYETSNYEY